MIGVYCEEADSSDREEMGAISVVTVIMAVSMAV